MKITKEQKGASLLLSLEGRLDTVTAPELEQEAKAGLDGVTDLTIDMKGLEYLSSAGLRVLLGMQKAMNKQGRMTVRNVNDVIREVFEVTGFDDVLTIL